MKYKIALVGEAWGEIEAQWRKPFVGSAGDELNSMLGDAGILREECYATNVFNFQPANNDIKTLCCSKRDGQGIPGMPAVSAGNYVKTQFLPELTRLYQELESVRPNIIIALGNTACWALLHKTAIGKLRGAIAPSPVLPFAKVLPTYHPAAVLRQYELRHVTVLDLMKAKVEAEFPEIRRPNRELWLDPTLADIERFYHEYILRTDKMAFDIETASNQITCIGFAPSIDRALVIPFVDQRQSTGSYWSTTDEELVAWEWVQRILAAPCAKVGQNTLYDIFYLWHFYGITVENYSDDTMILHHSLQPESPKGLDFLGSVYTNEPAWKTHRSRGKQTIKRED